MRSADEARPADRAARRTGLAALAAVVFVAGVLAGAAPAWGQATALTCPATFEVLHDDSIGALDLAAGPYTITLLDDSQLSCAEASDLFRQFLEDWQGPLPGEWVLDSSTATFTDGPESTKGFRVARATTPSGGGGGGHHPAHGTACPGPFRVLHDDRIGSFSIPAGNYRITLLSVGRLSCAQATTLFARFLTDFDGRLQRPWLLDRETASFMRGERNVGFRISPWSGKVPSGGSSTPASERRCPGTFRVLHRDRIGSLTLPRGDYEIVRLGRTAPSCSRAATLFARFLERPAGNLPGGWMLQPSTATFSREGSAGFRVERAP